jgi:GNAT superfamily N-acetyltransferase
MIWFRKLVPADLAVLRAFINRLDPEDRRARFAGLANDVVIDAYVYGINWATSVFLGGFVDGRLRGVAELRAISVIDRHAEFAIAVERGHQRRGIGTELTRHMLRLAQNRGLVRVTMWCLAENHRMRDIAARLGFRLVDENGQIQADLSVPLPDPESILREIDHDARAMGVAVIDTLAPAMPRITWRI